MCTFGAVRRGGQPPADARRRRDDRRRRRSPPPPRPGGEGDGRWSPGAEGGRERLRDAFAHGRAEWGRRRSCGRGRWAAARLPRPSPAGLAFAGEEGGGEGRAGREMRRSGGRRRGGWGERTEGEDGPGPYGPEPYGPKPYGPGPYRGGGAPAANSTRRRLQASRCSRILEADDDDDDCGRTLFASVARQRTAPAAIPFCPQATALRWLAAFCHAAQRCCTPPPRGGRRGRPTTTTTFRAPPGGDDDDDDDDDDDGSCLREPLSGCGRVLLA